MRVVINERDRQTPKQNLLYTYIDDDTGCLLRKKNLAINHCAMFV